jgi:hypothetical protein
MRGQSAGRAGELEPEPGAEIRIAESEDVEPADIPGEGGHGHSISGVREPPRRAGLQLAVHPAALTGEGKALEIGGLDDPRAEREVAVTDGDVVAVVL